MALTLRKRCRQQVAAIKENLLRGHLWQRILKNTLCTTILVAIGLIPAVIDVFGRSTYLGAMVSVFGYPGQRFGQMAEGLSLILVGTVVGLGWSILGLYLSSLAYDSDITAAYAIRAVFYALAVILHGMLRSSTPRLFLFVFFFLLMSLTVLTSTATSITSKMVSQICYPILTAVGVAILVNVSIFPESSSGFLGNSIIETLNDTIRCLEDAGDWFLSESQETSEPSLGAEENPTLTIRTKLVSLTDRKPKLRTKYAGSKKAQAECNFEVVYAVLPPRSLKPIGITAMSRLVQNTISVVNACESKYAMIGEEDDKTESQNSNSDSDSDESESDASSSSDDSSYDSDSSSSSDKPRHVRQKSKHARNLELVKPIREIESGDILLFEHILAQVRGPAKILQDQVHKAVEVISCCLAYCYEVPKLPSGAPAPRGIAVEEIDIRMEAFSEALALFDTNSAQALEAAAAMAYGGGSRADIMPRVETFLISSFLVTLRQAATQVSEMLKHCRVLVERREARRGRRTVYFPKISWKKWLMTGGEKDVNAVPDNARKEARAGHGTREEGGKHDEDPTASTEHLNIRPRDEETGLVSEKQPVLPVPGKIPHRKGPQKSESTRTSLWLRGLIADGIEVVADSEHLAFALKMSVAGWLITWPAFVPSMNAWYSTIRASWASLQLILVFEVSVGTSIQGFILRVFGVVYGCVAGFLAYEIGQGNRIVVVVVLTIASIPASYTHLGTPYVKTGIISIVSMTVVALATIIQPDTYAWEIFVKRMVCFLIGGTIALIIELTLFPVRARDRLVESLASSIQQIMNMEAAVAVGIEKPENIDIQSKELMARFSHAKEKAEAALSAAQTFLPFTLTEPRLKGSFQGHAMIYNEIIYVLHQIIDRMDHVLHLRSVYGSMVLQEMNARVLPYRRNMAASITLSLFSVHEALTTRLPLPQFLPSSRIAHLRYVSRVREVILGYSDSVPNSRAVSRAVSRAPSRAPSPTGEDSERNTRVIEPHVLKSVTKQNFLSWNASSAGLMEIIEYLEELVDLAKLLVGVNAFRTGMLERPKFHEYIAKIRARELDAASVTETQQTIERIKTNASANLRKRRGYSMTRSNSFGTMLSKRQTFNGQTGPEAAVDTQSEDGTVEDLPMSLQRVRTRRMEEQQAGRARRSSTADPKAKGLRRSAQTWRM